MKGSPLEDFQFVLFLCFSIEFVGKLIHSKFIFGPLVSEVGITILE